MTLIVLCSVLTESIVILHEDVKEAESPPCDRAVMSSWHLNRNAFTAKLGELAETGSSEVGLLPDFINLDT